MKQGTKFFLIAAAFVMFLTFAGAGGARGAEPAGGSPSILIAVFPLEDLRPSGETEGLGEVLAEGITDGLSGAPGIRVVERHRLKAVMDEIGLGMSGAVDEKTAIRVGKLLGANHLLLGSFMKFKGQVRVNARVVRTETGEITGTAKVTGKFEDILGLEDKLVGGILSSGIRGDEK
jgi:TolB-like protein